MPEGDTIHRAAALLGPFLVGRTVRRLELPRRATVVEAVAGKKVEAVEARGKNLLVFFEGGLVLHTHMKMNGRWRTYAADEEKPWAGGATVASIELEDGSRAVCWNAPVVRMLRARDLARDERIAPLGPDPIATSFDGDEAVRRLRARADVPLGEALLDQHAIAGIGNVWKSELLFEHGLDPFAPVSAFTDAELAAVLASARRRMAPAVRTGVRPSHVYDRSGRPCHRCGGAITMERQGEMRRSTYWCARCQPSRGDA